MNRFRPNFVVRGCDAYAEDGWGRLQIGDVPFRVAEACPRCAITTTDQETGERGKEPLRRSRPTASSTEKSISAATSSTTP